MLRQFFEYARYLKPVMKLFMYPYGMVTVTHLLKFFQIAFRQWRPFVFLFTWCGFLDGGIVYKRHFHIAVEELGKHEILCRQISSATDKQYVFLSLIHI